MSLYERIGSLPESHASPVAHIVASLNAVHTAQLLVDHDDRERVTGTVVLYLRSRLLTNGQHHVACWIAIGIDQLYIRVGRNQVNLSHTNSRNHVHRPAEGELHATRTILAVEHDTEIGTRELILILAVEQPALTLALVFSQLGIRQVTLERVVDATYLTRYIGRNQTLKSTLIIRTGVFDFYRWLLDINLLAKAELHNRYGATLTIASQESDIGGTTTRHQSRVYLHGTGSRTDTIGRSQHQPRLRDASHPVL